MRSLFTLVLLAVLIACTPDESVPKNSPIFVPPIEAPAHVLRFGLYASGKPTELIKDFSPILRELERYVSAELDADVEIDVVLTKTYEEGVDVIVNGLVDFARFGPASYIEAHERNESIDVLALESINGEKVFYGIIAVHEDSSISSIADLKDASVAFGDDQSTIGRYLSQQYLSDNGINAVDLKSFKYLGRHDKVGEAVGRREFVAGALNEKTFKKLVDRGVPIKELARFENVTKPWISSSELDKGMENLLREGLLQLTSPSSLARLKISGFIEGTNADYASIRESILNNRKFFEGYTNSE